jgi:hypothetical protein
MSFILHSQSVERTALSSAAKYDSGAKAGAFSPTGVVPRALLTLCRLRQGNLNAGGYRFNARGEGKRQPLEPAGWPISTHGSVFIAGL